MLKSGQEKKEKRLNKNKNKVLVLLDSHAILHRAYHALPEFSNSKGEPTGALYGLISMLIKIISDLKPDYIVAGYDLPSPTYRHEIFEGYKKQRKKAENDLISQIKKSEDVFNAFNIPIYSLAGFEADDILATIVEKAKSLKVEGRELKVIIASGDMDTLQLVDDEKVLVYTLRKGLSDTILYNEKKVIERFGFKPQSLPDFKGLRGDPSDNIPGIRGIGEKTATLLIKKFGSLEKFYEELKKRPEELKKEGIKDRIFELLKNGEEEAIFSKMLATVRRDAPINFQIPEKEWPLSFDLQKANSLFADLEFRTLGTRLKQVINTLSKDPLFLHDELPLQTAPKEDIEEVGIALWLLNSNITNPSLEDILQFSKKSSFEEAKDYIFQEIEKKHLTLVFEKIEKPLIPIVKKMEKSGIKIDKEYLKKLSLDYHKKLDSIAKKIYKQAGEEFNINSPRQLGNVIFEKLGLSPKGQKRTSTGMKSTKESELEKMLDLHPIIPAILEHRQFQKLLSTYIDSIPNQIDVNNRLHTNLRQTGTTTGRMSSTEPNLQNIPIKSELGRNIRKAFVAEKGFVLAAFDYSQIELRVAAILSGDEKLLNIFRKGEDVHTAVASEVFGVPLNKVDKEMRRKAKVINFGIIYGMGVNALRQNLGGTREEAQSFYNSYFERFKTLAGYLDEIKSDTERKGYTETLFGRRRYFEGIRSKIPYIKAASERMAINAPLQGTAADIIKLAMVEIDKYIEENNLSNKVRMLLQVHDELLFEIEKTIVVEIYPKIKGIMEATITVEKSKGIICEVHASSGPNWDDQQDLIEKT